MKEVKFNIDYTYCPKGHGDWVFIPSSFLYSDLFWCENCHCFYEPSVRRIDSEKINKSFSSDRASELVERANYIKWKNSLTMNDFKKLK